MTYSDCNTNAHIFVAIDVAKLSHQVLIEIPTGQRKKLKVANNMDSYQSFIQTLRSFGLPCHIGLEATGHYHRTLAYHLLMAGFQVHLIASLTSARTREAMYNSWDKNDPKDAQVILHCLKTGLIQRYHDPLINQINDIQEISKTYHQVSLRKVRVQHSIMNHYLPLYFPEVEKYFHSSRAQWFTSFLYHFPTPSSVLKYDFEDFVQAAGRVSGRKVKKNLWLADFYETAKSSIGLPIEENSQAIQMFRIILKEHQDLCHQMQAIQQTAEVFLGQREDYSLLKSIPGIGPIIALTILAEAGDLRRFSHHRQFLKFCGFDLSIQQSGGFRGQPKLSKHGNARLRYVFWIAATIAIRLRENTFRRKYENYIKKDPTNADIKRKAFTAVAVKIARVAYSIVKHQTNYRCYHDEPVIPSG